MRSGMCSGIFGLMALALAACHPVSQDSTAGGNPVPPADAPSDGAVSGSAPADASGAPSSNVSVD